MMDEQIMARIEADPRYRRLIRERSRLGWSLAMTMALAYGAFLLLIAFDKAVLARPIGGGVISLGIPVGFGLILLAILLTAIYVWRANRLFDRLTREIVSGIGA